MPSLGLGLGLPYSPYKQAAGGGGGGGEDFIALYNDTPIIAGFAASDIVETGDTDPNGFTIYESTDDRTDVIELPYRIFGENVLVPNAVIEMGITIDVTGSTLNGTNNFHPFQVHRVDGGVPFNEINLRYSKLVPTSVNQFTKDNLFISTDGPNATDLGGGFYRYDYTFTVAGIYAEAGQDTHFIFGRIGAPLSTTGTMRISNVVLNVTTP